MSTSPETDLIFECLAAWYGCEGSTEKDIDRVALVIRLVRERDALSLRDQFAGQALISMGTWMPMPDEGMPSLNTPKTLLARASWAYSQADAMIEARTAGMK